MKTQKTKLPSFTTHKNKLFYTSCVLNNENSEN